MNLKFLFLFYGFILILASIISLFLFKWKLALLSKELLSASIIKRSSKQFYLKIFLIILLGYLSHYGLMGRKEKFEVIMFSML